jgi:ATP-binding cassette subfamily B (MDR/TAP) protein 6
MISLVAEAASVPILIIVLFLCRPKALQETEPLVPQETTKWAFARAISIIVGFADFVEIILCIGFFKVDIPHIVYCFSHLFLWLISYALLSANSSFLRFWQCDLIFQIIILILSASISATFRTVFIAVRIFLALLLVIKPKQQISTPKGTLLSRFKLLLPFLWPNTGKLQFLVLCCFLLMFVGRFVNVLVPMTYKLLVDELTESEKFVLFPVLLYGGLRFLQAGIISSLVSLCWIPVQQFTSREIQVKLLFHLHSLSLDFHINRKTGEVLRIMEKGSSSISSLLSVLAFNIIPVFLDIGIAILYFIYAYDWIIAFIAFATMGLYILCTILITEWRTKFRRETNQLENQANAKAVDSILNFETVKYFNNETWEVDRYKDAILKLQNSDWKSQASLSMLNTSQNLIISTGLLAGMLLTAFRVSEKKVKVGDFVAFLAYLLQLYQPLNFFGTYYRMIQQYFVDMENMFDLFQVGQAIQDAPGAESLEYVAGKIEFKDVYFSYGENMVLKGVSFKVDPGKKVALVGTSGGGKSTILRLLFRFYDIKSGSILIDGKDIRTVTQHSLRKHIGVVPQDTVLFNDTIQYNILYGDTEATNERSLEAAKAAQIHERIQSFPKGYETTVGERGLRLSGGEKQVVFFKVAGSHCKNNTKKSACYPAR